MGLFHDLIMESRYADFEKEIKNAYQIGFQDGRLFPAEPRPCDVDGLACLFHRFVDRDKALLKINCFTRPEEQDRLNSRFNKTGIVPEGCSVEVVRRSFALVEYPDGSLGAVEPELVQFTDRPEE